MARIKPRPINHTSTRFHNLYHITSSSSSSSSSYSSSSFFNGFDFGYFQFKRMLIEVQGRDGDEVISVRRNSDSCGQDPLEVLGWDLMMKILGNLDACSVVISLAVSRDWNGIASSDRLWTSMVEASESAWMIFCRLHASLYRCMGLVFFKCEELWHGKAHIPRMSLVRGIPKLAAYTISVMDGKRKRIMRDDLCDHTWDFHFTEVAPEYWKNLDPYWAGTRPLMHRYFHQDGSQTADPGDRVWGGHECCFSIVTGILADGTIREHYVRINRWLRMSVSRKQDWSWEMSNHLVCYSSVPDSYKEGGTGPLFLVI